MAQGRPHLSSLFHRVRGRIETRRPLLHSREPCPEMRISPGSWQALPLATSAGQTQGFAPQHLCHTITTSEGKPRRSIPFRRPELSPSTNFSSRLERFSHPLVLSRYVWFITQGTAPTISL